MACRTSFEVVRQGRRQRRDLAPALEHRRHEAKMEIRDVDKKGSLVTLRGTPIVYDAPYKVRDILGEFNETMHNGAATSLLKDPNFDCRFFFDHKGMPMSSSLASTLKFEDTRSGLDTFPTIDIRSPSAMDLYVNVEAGNVRSMSIGFMTDEAGEKWDARGEDRHIYNLTALPDVSAVSFPGSTSTSIMLARSAFAFGTVDTRERLRRLYPIAKQFRSGQPVSQADGDLLIKAIESLYEADDLDEETLVEAFRNVQGSGSEEDGKELLIQRQKLTLANTRANLIAR
jgi:HK97 family phage prohead protease